LKDVKGILQVLFRGKGGLCITVLGKGRAKMKAEKTKIITCKWGWKKKKRGGAWGLSKAQWKVGKTKIPKRREYKRKKKKNPRRVEADELSTGKTLALVNNTMNS